MKRSSTNSTYSTDEQRRQRAKDQARWLQNVAVEALGQDLGNGTENGEVGMVGGQSMGQLLSKDSGASEWKHASRSAAATP